MPEADDLLPPFLRRKLRRLRTRSGIVSGADTRHAEAHRSAIDSSRPALPALQFSDILGSFAKAVPASGRQAAQKYSSLL